MLHDAAEAFMGDITRPLKQLLPDYKRIEASVQAAILERFGLAPCLPPEIKQADLRVLAAEQSQLMPAGTNSWARTAGVEPASIEVKHLPPELAKGRFLARFDALR